MSKDEKYEIKWITQGSFLGGEDNETSSDEVQGEKAVIDKLLDIAGNAGLEGFLVDGSDEEAVRKYRRIEKHKIPFQEAVDFLIEELSNLEVAVTVELSVPDKTE